MREDFSFEEKMKSFPDMSVRDLTVSGFLRDYNEFTGSMAIVVKSLLMDAVLAMLAGANSVTEKDIEKILPLINSEQGEFRPIFRRDVKTSKAMAGFVNGYTLRVADLCDTRRQESGRGGHPADMIAALLVLCDDPNVTGKKILETIGLGYNMWATIFNEMMYKRPDLDAATVLAITVPVLISTVYDEEMEQRQNALWVSAIGGPIAGEIRSSKIVTNSKNAATGLAIARAFYLHKMAEFVEAPPTMFTGKKSWASMVAPFEDFFRTYLDSDVFGKIQFKVFPCSNVIQGPVEAGINLHKKLAGKLDQISRICIRVCQKDAKLAIREGGLKYPVNHPSADHHLQFCTAIALQNGTLASKYFEPKYYEDESVRALIDKMEASVLTEEEFAALGGLDGACEVEVFLNDGTSIDEKLTRPCGLFVGMKTKDRAAGMQKTVAMKKDMIEQSYDYDLSEVEDIVYNFENHQAKELIDAIEKLINK